MVGVPGRSKACVTCRRRKKGCDYVRPACGQCRRAGLACGGYDRALVFVNATKEDPSPAGEEVLSSAEFDASAISRRIFHRRYVPSDAAEVALPDTLALTAYEEKYLGIYWNSFLPHGRAWPLTVGAYTTSNSTLIIQNKFRESAVLRLGLLANCLSMVGRRDKVPWMVEDGMKMYGRALKELNSCLQDPVRARKASTLASCRTLSWFEIYYGEDKRNHLAQSQSWQGHNIGELALLMINRPEAYIRGDTHALFCDGRLHLVITDLKKRKRSPLSDPQWKSIPWTEIPKTPKDRLTDILVDMPGLLEQFDAVKTSTHEYTDLGLREQFLTTASQIENDLIAWSSGSKMTGLAARAAAIDPKADYFSMQELAETHLMQQYWCCCLILYGTLDAFSGPQSKPIEHRNPRNYTDMLVRTMPILFSPSGARWGMLCGAFPMGLTWQFLLAAESANQISESRKELLTLFKGPRGKEVSSFLKSMQQNDPHAKPDLVAMGGDAGRKERAKNWVGVSKA